MFSNLIASAANFRIPSLNLSVAISSSFNNQRNVFSSNDTFSKFDALALKKKQEKKKNINVRNSLH